MRLRCVHFTMVVVVLGLLLIYSLLLNNRLIIGDAASSSLAALASDNSTINGQTLLVMTQTRQSGPSIIYTVKALLEESGRVDSSNASQQLQEKSFLKSPAIDPPGAPQENPPVTVQPQTVPAAPLTINMYTPGFYNPNPGLCPDNGSSTALFILITSAPSHFAARDAIRLTWGHYGSRSDVQIGFIVGHPNNETTSDLLTAESALYSDLIQANFFDSYDNLTLKTMASLEWMVNYCNQSKFLLKTDDDMFINVPNLMRFIEKIKDDDSKDPKIYGRLAKKWKPVRNKKSKYYISYAQYKNKVYPDFTTGPAYLLSTGLARGLYEKGLSSVYLKLEDVYTTGIIAQSLKIKRMNIADFANKKVNFHKTGFCALSRLISMHMVAYHEQFELWRRILDGRTKCRVIVKKT